MPQLTHRAVCYPALVASFFVMLLVTNGADARAFGLQPQDDPELARAFKLFE